MRTLWIKNREEIDRIIRSCRICYLAMAEENIPYILPMNFALDGDTVILHSAPSGRMWKTVKKNPRVCMNWTQGEELAWQHEQVGCSYRMKSRSVIVEGVAEEVEDYNEKVRCLEQILAHYSNRKFKFNAPAVNNVGILKVKMEKITGKEFGANASVPWDAWQ